MALVFLMLISVEQFLKMLSQHLTYKTRSICPLSLENVIFFMNSPIFLTNNSENMIHFT